MAKHLFKQQSSENELSSNHVEYIRQSYNKGLQLEEKSRAKNTIKRYKSAFNILCKYCKNFNENPLPLTPEIAYTFFVYLHDQGYSWSSITVIKSAIDYHHKTQGHLSPLAHPRIETLIQGIHRDISKKTKSSNPVTYDMLVMVIDQIGNDGLLNSRDKALLLVGFAGGFRASELLALKKEDLNFNDTHGVIITIRKSKTDQIAKGHDVAIPFNHKSQKHCPVSALQSWVDSININDEDYVFKSLHKGGCQIRKERLSYEGFYQLFKKRCQQAGLDTENLSPHGLRSGFNTSAALAGADLIKMREITNQSLNTQQRYIKKVNLFDNNANNSIYAYFET